MEIVVKDESAKATTFTGTLKGMGEALRTITTNTGDRVELVGENWPQIASAKGKTYTKYKKIAEKWARELLAKNGDIATRY